MQITDNIIKKILDLFIIIDIILVLMPSFSGISSPAFLDKPLILAAS
jgi:hypothetical protein